MVDKQTLKEILENATLPWTIGESGDLELSKTQVTNTCPFGEREGTNLYLCDRIPDGDCRYRFTMAGSKEAYCGRMIDR